MNTLLLVDGNALFYRAYHAFPKDLTTPDGTPSGAAYGFTRILLAAIRTLKPTHLAVCFDVAGGSFREDLFEKYKATRSAMPEDLLAQVPIIWEIVEALEAPRYTAERFEADDVIGTIANQAVKGHEGSEPLNVIILSGDQDLLQLVNDSVRVYAPAIGFQRTPTLYTPEKVQEKYGFAPAQMVDYKSLRGDPSDNIPGVPGIGEKTASELIKQFGTLDKLYETVGKGETDGLKPAVLKKLNEGEASARLSYTLATIHCEAPVSFESESARLHIENPDTLVSLFNKLGFKSLIRELPSSHKLVSEAADVFGQIAPDSIGSTNSTPPKSNHESLSESEKFDQELTPVLREMEEYGVMVDKPYLATLEEEFEAEAGRLVVTLHDLAGQPFNPDSPQQVADIFYEKLHIPTTNIRKGKSGYTTDAETMRGLSEKYPIASVLLQYREVTKLLGTYIKPLQALADKESRIHTSYAPDTATGRLSSKNPNLQNIPTKTEQGRRIRKAFIAPKGNVLVAADYSQMELRVAAHLSGDPVMMEAFQNGKDFHAETAARMGVDRRVAKIINFSILYGKGAYGFSQDLGISMAEAKAYIEQYFRTYSKLRHYLDSLLVQAREEGFVSTLFGRRRYLPDLTSSNYQRRSAAEREAVNMPIQGTQADILKKAMLDTAKRLKGCKAHMILTVHDEIVIECPANDKDTYSAALKECMEQAVTLTVPVLVQVKNGPDWASVE